MQSNTSQHIPLSLATNPVYQHLGEIIAMAEGNGEESEPMTLSLLTKSWQRKYEIAIEFRLSNAKEEDQEAIALAFFVQNYKSKLMRKFNKNKSRIV